MHNSENVSNSIGTNTANIDIKYKEHEIRSIAQYMKQYSLPRKCGSDNNITQAKTNFAHNLATSIILL